MVRQSFRRFLNPEFRARYQVYLQTQSPEDDQQLRVLEDCFPDLTVEQYFRIFQILNNREHPRDIQNIPEPPQIQNVPQIRNQARNQPVQNRNLNQQRILRMAQQQPAAIFVDDPYHGDINPGTTDGAKLYLKATTAIKEDEKFDLNISTAQKFLDLMRRDSNNFGWGALIRAIPEADANTNKNLLKDHKVLTEEHMKRQAYKTWGNQAAVFNTPVPDGHDLEDLDPANNQAHRPAFFRRVRSRMIAKRIMGHLKTADMEILKNQAELYTWSNANKEEMDGPMMLWLLLQACNPSTRVGISELKTDLRNATSAKFQHNVKKLTDFMSSKYREIEEKGQTHQDYQLDLFNALQTVPNPDFASRIRDERQAWEIGGNKQPNQIIAEALTIYNNAVSANRWDDKDPKDAKIMALTTQVEQLVDMQKSYSAMVTNGSAPKPKAAPEPKQKGDFLSIKAWRMKKTQDSVQQDGKTWYWCPHHKVEGSYDGLYVTHKPEEHEEWKNNKAQFRKKKTDERKEANSSNDDQSSKKLYINDNLKAALMTHCDISGAQLDELLEESQIEPDF